MSTLMSLTNHINSTTTPLLGLLDDLKKDCDTKAIITKYQEQVLEDISEQYKELGKDLETNS